MLTSTDLTLYPDPVVEVIREAKPANDAVFVSQTFAKSELPKEHRVVKEGDMMSMDHKPERYVHVFLVLSSP